MSTKIDEIIISNLNKSFNGKGVINNLSMRIPGGSKIAISGKSGSGKSTLLNIIMGFMMPDSGTIELLGSALNDKNVHKMRREISWVPQEMNTDINYVKELLLLPFNYHHNNNCMPSEGSINHAIKRFGLKHSILNQEVGEISGGEKQRLFLAASSLLKRKIYLLDEPTSSLDSDSKLKVMDYFLNECNSTVVAVTHENDWMAKSDIIVNMNKNFVDIK